MNNPLINEIRILKDRLEERETYWKDWNGRASKRIEELERESTQRGERLEIMRQVLDTLNIDNMRERIEKYERLIDRAIEVFDREAFPCPAMSGVIRCMRKAREVK